MVDPFETFARQMMSIVGKRGTSVRQYQTYDGHWIRTYCRFKVIVDWGEPSDECRQRKLSQKWRRSFSLSRLPAVGRLEFSWLTRADAGNRDRLTGFQCDAAGLLARADLPPVAVGKHGQWPRGKQP